MTIDEAYESMKNGDKISHVYFTADEYLYIDSHGIIRDENKYNFSDGWRDRKKNDAFNTGWYKL